MLKICPWHEFNMTRSTDMIEVNMVKGQTQCHSDQVLVSDRLPSHDASINQVWSRLNDIRDMLRYKISTDKVKLRLCLSNNEVSIFENWYTCIYYIPIIKWLNTAIT